MKIKSLKAFVLAVLTVGLYTPTTHAISYSYDLSWELSDSQGVFVELEITPDNTGYTLFSLNVLGGAAADIVGFWGHIEDESLVPGLSITPVLGTIVPSPQFLANGVNDLGGGVNLNGGGGMSPAPADFGVRFEPGTPPGTGTSVAFVLSHSTEDLTTALFPNTDSRFGVRLTSIGGNDGESSKLANHVPDSGNTMVLMGLALAGLFGWQGRGKITQAFQS